jgi:hypothetical protein
MNIHLGYRPGCIGRIVELHAGYYARTAGFGVSFEAKVASGLAAFCVDYQEGRDGLWLAEQDGVIHGSIAIDGSHHENRRFTWPGHRLAVADGGAGVLRATRLPAGAPLDL